MEFVALGDTDEIGASCLFLKINETGILLDAGADPEEEGEASLPNFDILKNGGRSRHDWYVDHAVITHAHHDHMGSLPILIREFPHVVVHMTPVTRQFVEFLLPASARLQRRRLREGSSLAEPLFTVEEVEMHSHLYLTHELEESFPLSGMQDTSAITGRLFNAGHVLGAAGIEIEFEEKGSTRRLFYTSDTSLRPQHIIPGGNYPEGPVDILLLESTLGADPDAELTTRKLEEERLLKSIQRVLDRQGTILIPVFALGRAQEILAVIDRFKSKGYIDEDIPVYTAGSMRAVADLYDKSRHTTPRLDPEFQVFGVSQKRLPRSTKATQEALSQPSIHVMSSGMMFERTISNRLAQQLVEDEKNGIFLVGYAKDDSPAHHLLEAVQQGKGTEVTLDRLIGPQPINCDVERFRFSGHSHRRELLQIVEQLKPKKIVLVHGETEARDWMADNIRYFYPEAEIFRPEQGEVVQL